jgi:hypothetical protein
MRIAISGTHCCGKSSLIEAFLVGHPDYIHEPEAYEALQDLHGETFAAEPSADDFYRQLEYQVARVQEYRVGDLVIFERSPADYLAYMLALQNLGRESADAALTDRALPIIKDAVALLDLIVYLPAMGNAPDSEDPKLRNAVDTCLENILLHDEFALFTANGPIIIEASGTTAERLRALEMALG